MRNSSKHQYPDSFDSLSSGSSSGHIEHLSVDMDTHDRAVRRNAGHHSRSSSGTVSSGVPLWLITILLFIGIVGFFLIRIPAKFKSSSGASVEPVSVSAPAAQDSADQDTAPLSESASPADGGDADSVSDGSALLISGDTSDGESPRSLDDVSAGGTEFSTEPLTAEPSAEPAADSRHIHSYLNGVCSVCGATPEFLTDYLPEEFYRECSHPGTVTKHDYDVTSYVNESVRTLHKSFNIYLPYGYDESRPYNVLILVHGGGGDEDSWLNTVYHSGDYSMSGRVILDNMFEQGICEPCIVVTPATESSYTQGLTAGIMQMQDELRDYIMPYIAEHYSTYAADSSIESLVNARDHFGLGGVSNGALFTFEGGMRHNFDLFGSYLALSGDGEPWITAGIIESGDYATLPVNCFFTGAGTMNDWQQNYTEIGFDYFVERDSRFVEGTNAWHVDVEGGHEWKVWFTDLYNALPLMFQQIDF